MLADDVAQRQVDVGKAGTGEHAFGRHAAIFLAQPAQYFDGKLAGGREGGMPAFGGQNIEAAIVGDDAADTQSGAHADDGADALSKRQLQSLRTDRLQVRGTQSANRVSHRLEVIDDAQLLEPLRLAQGARRKRPATVGELYAVLVHAPGHRHGGAVQRDRYTRCAAAIVLRGMRDGFVCANGISANAMDIERAMFGATDCDAEADMRTADVGHQPQHRGVIEVFPAI